MHTFIYQWFNYSFIPSVLLFFFFSRHPRRQSNPAWITLTLVIIVFIGLHAARKITNSSSSDLHLLHPFPPRSDFFYGCTVRALVEKKLLDG